MILVTGGTGYIGSHACAALMQAGHNVLALDNLSNSRADILDRLAVICGRRPDFVAGDVRDCIQVMDLAEGHVSALNYLECEGGMLTVNLGTGRGYSVLEMVKAFEQASARAVPYNVAPRRPASADFQPSSSFRI
jgi:UDP-glucose 4-epimerase